MDYFTVVVLLRRQYWAWTGDEKDKGREKEYRNTISLQSVASARRSGQEDFQRGTPPVSLASCSISPILRACIITE